MRIAHLTDIHLAPMPPVAVKDLMSKRVLGYVSWHRNRKAIHRREVLDAIAADLDETRPDHVVITGDLVNISLKAEFVQATAWLQGLAGRDLDLTVIPGNHDAYVEGAGEKGWPMWLAWMAGEPGDRAPGFPFEIDLGSAVLIGLSTAVPTAPGFASGLLGSTQLALLEKILARLADAGKPRIVLLHHPPVEGWSPDRKALKDAAAFRRAIARHGAELILCGHDHVLKTGTVSGPQGGVPVVCGPSASLLKGPIEENGGYLVYDLADLAAKGAIAATLRRYDPRTGRLGETARFELRSS